MSEAKTYILKRDGMKIASGAYIEMMEWVHRNHCYSLDHALKYEGYSLEELPAKTLAQLIVSCETEARAHGFTGEDWEPTAIDLDWVVDQLGHKPTRDKWTEAGLPYVGGRHAEEEKRV